MIDATDKNGPSQFSWWLKLLLTWGVGALLAWATMANRVGAVESEVKMLRESLSNAQQRATEDRGDLRLSTDRLTAEIRSLRDDLERERLQRVMESSGSSPARTHGRMFDK